MTKRLVIDVDNSHHGPGQHSFTTVVNGEKTESIRDDVNDAAEEEGHVRVRTTTYEGREMVFEGGLTEVLRHILTVHFAEAVDSPHMMTRHLMGGQPEQRTRPEPAAAENVVEGKFGEKADAADDGADKPDVENPA